jgi:hypothetical protein
MFVRLIVVSCDRTNVPIGQIALKVLWVGVFTYTASGDKLISYNLTLTSLSRVGKSQQQAIGQIVTYSDTNHAYRTSTSMIQGKLVHLTCYPFTSIRSYPSSLLPLLKSPYFLPLVKISPYFPSVENSLLFFFWLKFFHILSLVKIPPIITLVKISPSFSLCIKFLLFFPQLKFPPFFPDFPPLFSNITLLFQPSVI